LLVAGIGADVAKKDGKDMEGEGRVPRPIGGATNGHG